MSYDFRDSCGRLRVWVVWKVAPLFYLSFASGVMRSLLSSSSGSLQLNFVFSDVEDKFKILTFQCFVMYIAVRYHLVCKACRRKNCAFMRKLCASTSVLQTQMYVHMCCSSMNNIKCKNNEIPIYQSLLLNTVYVLSRSSFYQTRHVANYCISFWRGPYVIIIECLEQHVEGVR
jgi:hypothetical protein